MARSAQPGAGGGGGSSFVGRATCVTSTVSFLHEHLRSAKPVAAYRLGECPPAGPFLSSTLTFDAELGAGEDEPVPVLGHALVHARIREAHRGYVQRPLLDLNPVL